MIKKYLEIIETLTEEEMLAKQPQIVRIEVTGLSDARDKLPEYEPAFEGLDYVKRMLTQRHFEDASKNQPCEITPL